MPATSSLQPKPSFLRDFVFPVGASVALLSLILDEGTHFPVAVTYGALLLSALLVAYCVTFLALHAYHAIMPWGKNRQPRNPHTFHPRHATPSLTRKKPV